MTPEARRYFDKSFECLQEAQLIAGIGLAKAAARSAYYAAFHSAEALILERTGKVAKTHSGVRSEFSRLAGGPDASSRRLVALLSEAYKYKELGDYGVGDEAIVPIEAALDLIVRCRAFVATVEAMLA